MSNESSRSAPTEFPRESASFLLPGPVGDLEVACEPAETRAKSPPAGIAVICHPHPLHGGTMHNKVVTIIERSLRELGLDTVRFNFRGIGKSGGTFDEGEGESDDLASVVRWARTVRPEAPLWLAGFSFGSYVALRNAKTLDADALITIAPPVGRWDFDAIDLPDCPWLVVQGEEDEVVDPQLVFDWVESLDVSPHLVRMPETSHFFHRRLMDLRGAVKNAMRAYLPKANDPA
ncbi:MAG: alpha/beta hydrolase [Xanthomonadales bacterium]|uniref:alpha/beta hydrolase n=1 Tax=Dokdonella sp. TaxID=2291710 RepID=UPI002BD1B9B4|nr:alpha/beta hydrolase [Xanthomonadales bacterium]HQV72379.1 alpha/beta hydrolase [Dokdonella sp.]MBK7013550.1 alpha/beta hydrolase [Xanthomonadales bacterium]MBK7210047.1 alpha/beta hydrolase [Xanthomonadales bacterium]MBL0222695.1 alpha/beta hydrolase [Xanthomonadales bacterium]